MIIAYQVMVFMAQDALVVMTMIPIVNLLTNLVTYIFIAICEWKIEKLLPKAITYQIPFY